MSRFIEVCGRPALLEPGTPVRPIERGCYLLEVKSGRPTLQVWGTDWNLVRRIAAVRSESSAQLCLTVEHFGKRQGEIVLLDLARQSSIHLRKRGTRMVWRERFRMMLSRELPGWSITELSTEPNLQHTLSPAYARALLTRGTQGIAVIGAGPDRIDPAQILTFGLIWFDYLRQRNTRQAITRLAVWMPAGSERSTALRMRHLRFRADLYSYSEDDFVQKLDAADCGNVDTVLEPRMSAMPMNAEVLRTLGAMDGVEVIDLASGALSLRVRGLEFARGHGELSASLGSRRPLTLNEAVGLAGSLAHFRRADSDDPQNALFRKQPEAWLEGQVRKCIATIDPSLASAPIYGQVPAFAAADRGVLDLLTCDHRGRLAVIEIKATADPELPLQALDYWLRVRWHLERGEFAASGYFPGMQLSSAAPRLILVAPALEFHETTETVVKYFSQEIEVRRIGVSARWRERLEVAFVLDGASRPFSR